MQITKYSDDSISLLFNNVDIAIIYPLVRVVSGFYLKLNTEFALYKFTYKKDVFKLVSDMDEYTFKLIVLGFGIDITYTIQEEATKDIQH